MSKPFLRKKTWVVQFNSYLGEERVNTFPKSICLKVNVIAYLEFESDFNDVAVNYVIHYAIETPLCWRKENLKGLIEHEMREYRKY